MRRAALILALAATALMLLYAVGRMPPMGDPGNPDKTHVVPRYLERGEEEAGAKNFVTGVILNYRGYDTMGEVTVIFSALCAVVAVLDRERRGRSRSGLDASKVKPSVILRTVVRFSVPIILFFALYMMLHGENSPGGGFQGGAIVGASVILFALAFGLPKSTLRFNLKARVALESSAMIAFLAVGFIGMGFGLNFLSYALPGLSHEAVHTVRNLMMAVVEVGIGVGGGVIFTSIILSMLREDAYELEGDSS